MLAGLIALASLATDPTARPTVSVRDIVEVSDMSGLSASPDGRYVAFRLDRASIASNGYQLGWYVVATDGRTAPHLIGNGGDALFTDAGELATQMPIWSPTSDAIYYRALMGDAVQIWRATIDGAGATQWTRDPADIRDLALGPDGRSIVYHVAATRTAIAAAEQQAQDDGVVVDASVDIAQPIVRGSFINGKPASQRLTGDWFARGDILWRTPVTTATVTLSQPDIAAPVGTGRTKFAMVASASFATVKIDRRRNPPELIVQPSGRGRILCQTPQCRAGRVVSAAKVPDSRQLLVTTDDATQDQTLSLWRPGARSARTLATSSGLLNGGRDPEQPCATSALALVCVAASAVSPPRLVRIDLRDGAQTILFDPNGSLRTAMTARAEALTWRIADGTLFSAELLLPVSPKPATGYPMVMNYYDCPGFLRGGLGDELPILPLAAGGIATLCINQPHTDPTKRDAEVDYATALSGISAVVDRLSASELIDRRHIGMSGLSFGSEIVMAVAERSDLLAAAAISTGQPEPGFYWFNSVAGRDTPEVLRKAWQVGDPDSDASGWKRISPALNTEKIHVPLLMQLPEQEARWSMELYSKLSRSTTPVEMVAFSNEPHIKEQPRHKDAVYGRNLDWFRFWLQGYLNPEPAKSAWLSRWRPESRMTRSLISAPDRPGP